MGQNLVGMHYTEQQWSAVDTALDALDLAFKPALVALGKQGRRTRVKMGDGSRPFCEQAHTAMAQNRQLLPPGIDLEEMARDLATHDALNRRLARLVQLVEHVRDTEIALGSDAMRAALDGYSFLKRHADGAAIDALREQMGERFAGQGKNNAEPVAG